MQLHVRTCRTRASSGGHAPIRKPYFNRGNPCSVTLDYQPHPALQLHEPTFTMESARTDIGAPLRGSRLCQNCGRSNGNRAYACKSCHQQLPRKGQSIKERKRRRECIDVSNLTHQDAVPSAKRTFPFAYENVVQTTVPLFVSSPMIL